METRNFIGFNILARL